MEAVLIGAGRRGFYNFGSYALEHPDELRYMAVAEPMVERRERFARAHHIPRELCFESWEDLVARRQLAPAMFNSANDATHYASSIGGLTAGYDVLLEKPMATSPADCASLVEASGGPTGSLWVFHELRATDLFSRLYRIVRSGRIGDVVSIEHHENVAYWHMAHSFVRGNWSRSDTSGPMILTKCCHDMDLLTWILGSRAERISPFGSLSHFRPEGAPQVDVPERCTDGCPVEDTCPYYAPRLYLDGIVGNLATALSIEDDYSSRLEALRTGPYGRCVYRSTNNVVDHQTVNMEFEGGVTATLTMNGLSHKEERTMRYDGTEATLFATFGGQGTEITIHDLGSDEVERISPQTGKSHGGGDERLIAAFVKAVREDDTEQLSGADEALESHLMAFAAEESRTNDGAVIEMTHYRERLRSNLKGQGRERDQKVV